MRTATPFLAVAVLVSPWIAAPASGAEFLLQIVDPPGVGFNDPTPVAPVPGNPGNTLGEQRINAFVAAAEEWGETLASDVPIVVEAEMPELFCDPNSAVLGAAGTTVVFRDFAGAALPGTWYASALADSLAGLDLDPGEADIAAVFNSAIDAGDPDCIAANTWWYGIGAPAPPGTVPFFLTVQHELAHGQGFTTFYDRETGEKLVGFDDAYMVFLEDHPTGLTWPEMTDAERLSSSVATGDLHWVGPGALAQGVGLNGGRHPSGHLSMYAPDPFEQGSSVSHWDISFSPDELMEPILTDSPEDGATVGLLTDIGWGLVGEPEPPAGPWLTSPELPGFEAKVRITPLGGSPLAGSSEPQCIIETLCVSGALAGRPEVFIKVIGPRPNGFLWSQVSRFTPSQVEIWLRQLSTGQINFYLLAAVGPGSDDVSGLQDRGAFTP